MSQFTQRIMVEGQWDITLDGIPDYLLKYLIDNPFGEVYVTPQRLPASFHTKTALRDASLFTGVLLRAERNDITDQVTISAPSNTFWLGDSSEHGPILKTQQTFDSADPAAAVTTLLPATVTAGSIQTPVGATTYDGIHYLVTPKVAITAVAEATDREYGINPDNTADFGDQDQLGYITTPTAVLIERPEPFADPLETIRPTDLNSLLDVEDFANEPLLTGEGGGQTIILGDYLATTTFKDPEGNALEWRGLFNEQILYSDLADARAQVIAETSAAVRQQVTVSLDRFLINGTWGLGDWIYAYIPPFLTDSDVVLSYAGSQINPTPIRIVGLTLGVGRDMGVYFRDHTDTIHDLSNVVEPTEMAPTLEIGEVSRPIDLGGVALGGAGSTPADTRAPSQPSAPTCTGAGNNAIRVTHDLTVFGGGDLEIDLHKLKVYVGESDPPDTDAEAHAGHILANYTDRDGLVVEKRFRDYNDTIPTKFERGTTYYVVVVATDNAGNDSIASPSTSVVAGDQSLVNPPTSPAAIDQGVKKNADGTAHGQIRFAWTASTTTFVDRYVVKHRLYGETKWGRSVHVDSDETLEVVVDVPVGERREFRVRALDSLGNKSAWTATVDATAGGDVTAPGTPPTPTLAKRSLGAKVFIDLSSGGYGAANIDVKKIQVFGGTTTSPTTKIDHINVQYDDLVSGETLHKVVTFTVAEASGDYFIRIKAKDASSNISCYSAQASINDARIGAGAFDVGAIAGGDIAAGAISQVKVASGLSIPQVVGSLPANASNGDVVLLTTDAKLYRWTGAAWTKAVDGSDLIVSSVTADKMTVATLSAITANLGTVNAGSISGLTGEIGGFTIGASSLTAAGNAQVLTSPSSDSAPGLGYTADPSTGVRFTGGPSIRLLIGGSAIAVFTASQLTFSANLNLGGNTLNMSSGQISNLADPTGNAMAMPRSYADTRYSFTSHNHDGTYATSAHGHLLGSAAGTPDLYYSGPSTYKRNSSSWRIKTDIATVFNGDSVPAMVPNNRRAAPAVWHNPVLTLTPVLFHAIDDGKVQEKVWLGLIAEEVRDKFPSAYTRNLDDPSDLGRWDVNVMTTALLAKVREHETRIAVLDGR